MSRSIEDFRKMRKERMQALAMVWCVYYGTNWESVKQEELRGLEWLEPKEKRIYS